MNILDPFDQRRLAEEVIEHQQQIHDEAGDVWARRTGSPPRDHAADARIRAEIAAEARGEWDPETGQYRRCTWTEAG